MNRRAVLLGSSVVLSTTLAGCSSDETSDDSGNGDGGNTEVRVDETVYSDSNYNVDAEEGDEISVDVNVHEGMITVVRVVNLDSSESLHREDVETETSFDVQIEESGTYSIRVMAQGETDIHAEITPSS